MDSGLCLIIVVIVLLVIVLTRQPEDNFTLPLDGGYVYGPDYGGMADKEVEADSLMT